MYKLLRKLFFLFPPETTHLFAMACLKGLQTVGLMRYRVRNSGGRKEVFGLKFPNLIGLGAGFDKNAQYLDELQRLGFGFVEIGTVTPQPQVGNEQPRLFRLPQDEGLINRMGFNNDGVQVITERLKQWREKQQQLTSDAGTSSPSQQLLIGGNIGKNKVTANEDAWKDYETCFKSLHPYVDYFVVNVSSPNTPGLRELQQKDSLRKILRHLQMINNAKSIAKPILLKISPDLKQEQLDDIIDLVIEINLDGIVATNTTTSRGILVTPPGQLHQIGQGGLSGKPLQKRSTEIVRYIHERTGGIIPIVASGGIFSADDVREKINAGASLVQVWTGFIYEGPGIVKNILKEL
ncbi:MAG TPA: quinone-dependent dihydroorotate dehydrogenase [Chitinophagaceae bacterium]|nr:quinone-dependent dihydroorotate dehydrogenase [Chitinophagaceae bacterium]